jgi:signal transduction histidine kinase
MKETAHSLARYERAAALCGIVALVVGLAVLAGWLYNIPRLTDFTFDGIAMKANASATLALAGVALLLLRTKLPRWRSAIGVGLAILVTAIGALTLSEHLVGWDLGIDQLIANEPPGAAATASPGRMGPPASTSFTLIGIALVLLNRRSRRAVLASQAIALAVMGVTLLNLVGNFFGAPELYSVAIYSGISRQMALLLFITAIGLLAARPNCGLMAVFSSDEPGGVILRRLLIPSFAFPLVFGRLCVYGIEAGWFGATYGIALFMLVLVATLVGVISWNCHVLNILSRHRQQAERERELLLESERQARAEAERSARLKDDFLATLSHELRTPLNAILGWAHVIQNENSDSATFKTGLKVIAKNARMQSELISDLLDMSRITSGKMRLEVQPVDLHAVIHSALESVRLAAEQKAVQLKTVLESIEVPVAADPARLQQIVGNLLSNALKFTPTGGLVEITLKATGSYVQIVVSDTGQGIAPEFLPHVFDRFRQADSSVSRNTGGLGLGLAIVKELVELQGGRVAMHSDGIGRGATCIVELPIAVSPENVRTQIDRSTAAQPITAQNHPLAGLSILVLDDDADTIEVITRVLLECGADVCAALNANQALGMLQLRKFDLVVSDIGMPGTNGYDFIRVLRSQGLRMPAIALTAYVRPEDRDRILEAGFQLHIGKPVEPAELLSKIVTLLRSTPRVQTRAS